MTTYNVPKYASEQVARDLGYGGDFGAGGAGTWLRQQNKLDAYYKKLADGGITEGKTKANLTLQQQMATNVNNPVLANGAQAVPQTMTVQPNEIMQAPNIQAPQPLAAPAMVAAPVMPTAVLANTGQYDVNAQQILHNFNPQTGQYEASLVGNQTPQVESAQGQVSELATVQGQLKKLYGDTTDGKVPDWAKGAVKAANEVMAARGLGNSSIAASAITAAIQQSALNIAAPDAATYFQMDMTNLNNEQQARLTNVQLKQQSLLTDTAAINAAKQFNASSEAQVEMFQANLIGSIQTQNAARRSQLDTFNVAEINKGTLATGQMQQQADIFNVQQKVAVDQYNSNLKYQTDAFNANMRNVVDQSNVAWRRQTNTANTAAINAANQLNVMNAYNMSTYSLNALWQNMRDQMQWMWQSSENATDREHALGLAAIQRDANLDMENHKFDLQSDWLYQQTVGAIGTSIFQDFIGTM